MCLSSSIPPFPPKPPSNLQGKKVGFYGNSSKFSLDQSGCRDRGASAGAPARATVAEDDVLQSGG